MFLSSCLLVSQTLHHPVVRVSDIESLVATLSLVEPCSLPGTHGFLAFNVLVLGLGFGSRSDFQAFEVVAAQLYSTLTRAG